MAYNAMISLLNKLTGKLLEEVGLLREVEDRVWSLVCMLKRLRPFVMEVQRNQRAEIMKEFIELVSEANEAIDFYVTNNRRPGNTSDSLSNHIERIKWKLKIWQKRCLSTSTASSSVVEPVKDDDMVVGLENEVTMMIERLKDKDPRRDVIPIVGPGGVGKTTLARRVYYHPIIVENFPCRAWIYAYNDYEFSMKKLLQEIINQVSPPPPPATAEGAAAEAEAEDNDQHQKKMILRDLAIRSYNHLKNSKRYLLVFDDVCRTQFWADINMIFPDNNHGDGGGGRIIFTTRYDEVASTAMSHLNPFYLRSLLNKEESWKLFSNRVSRFGDRASTSSGPPELDHHPWKEWVDACGGLPLAIVALAEEHHQRLKSSSSTPDDKKEDDDDDRDQRFPKRIWELIYNSLPHHLKPCLLYFGVLNSCSSTQFKELMIAEGLVEVAELNDYDTIAEEYLNELINRNLVEVASKRWDGSIKDITIRNGLQLMDFCRFKAREEKFLEFGDPETFPQEANRIAVESQYRDYIAYTSADTSSPLNLKACSFLILDYPHLPWERNFMSWYWDFLIQNFKFLRVVDLFGVDFNANTIPSEIENLVHLVCLRLNCVGGIILPPSICNLWNLQILRVKNNSSSSSSEIPLERFWKMRQLKRLLCSSAVLLPPQTSEDLVLNNIERLKLVSVRCCTTDILSKMPNLVRLGVGVNIQKTDIAELSKSLPLLKRLQKLALQGAAKNDNKLSLHWWDAYDLPSITHVTFKWTRLVGNPMSILGKKLPNLQVLKLAFNAIDGEDLNVSTVTTDTDHGDGWFRQLKCLKLEEMGITRWNLSVGAMPRLEIVVIRNCTSLRRLPSEALQEINTLRELEIYNYSSEAVKTAAIGIQEHVGKDRLELRLK